MTQEKPPLRRRRTAERPGYSAYSSILDKPVTVTIEGLPRSVSAKAALQWKTFEEAINGKVGPTRDVLGWIDEREIIRSKQGAQNKLPMILFLNNDPVGMDDALLLLDIAVEDRELSTVVKKHVKLQPWATQEALNRHKLKAVCQGTLRDWRVNTHDPDEVIWPEDS